MKDAVDKERLRAEHLRTRKSVKFDAGSLAAPTKLQLVLSKRKEGKYTSVCLAHYKGSPVALKEYMYRIQGTTRSPLETPETSETSEATEARGATELPLPYVGELKKLEGDVKKLAGLLEHENVCGYKSFASSPPLDGVVTISLSTEYCPGGSIDTLLKRHGTFSPDVVNKYAKGMIAGLRFLHSCDVIHENIKLSTVFLDSEGTPRLAYFGSSQRRLKRLCNEQRVDDADSGSNPASDKRDLALVVKEMLLGLQPPDTVIPLTLREKLSSITETWLEDNLPACLANAESGFFGADSGTRSPVPWAQRVIRDTDDQHDGPHAGHRVRQTSQSEYSRYKQDFDEVECIGRGGFGSVYKARNHLDRRLYAVKKIKLDSLRPNYNKKIMREVVLLSRLQHQHVVRYFQSWIEEDTSTSSSSEDDSEDDGSGYVVGHVGYGLFGCLNKATYIYPSLPAFNCDVHVVAHHCMSSNARLHRPSTWRCM